MPAIKTIKKKLKPKQQPIDKKAVFIRALAEFFTVGQVQKSIRLEMNNPDAVQWANLRRTTPLFGYPTTDEAERELIKFLK